MGAIDWRKLVAKREFDNPMEKHAVKVVLGNETVGQILPREFSRVSSLSLAWYFLARSGEISVKVIGRRRHCRQLRNSMPVRVYLFKHTANETLERTTGEQDSGLEPEDPNKRLLKEPSLLLKAMINKTF